MEKDRDTLRGQSDELGSDAGTVVHFLYSRPIIITLYYYKYYSSNEGVLYAAVTAIPIILPIFKFIIALYSAIF